MKQLITIIIISFVNVNDQWLMINKSFVTKVGGNNEFKLPVLLLAKIREKIGLRFKINN